MKYKTFNYKRNKNCAFEVSNYQCNPQAMAILIVNSKGEEEARATVNMLDYFYSPNTATIKNYSENTGMTEFLKQLGILEDIYSRKKCHPLAIDTETIDYCQINVEKLKEYSKTFNYEWNI